MAKGYKSSLFFNNICYYVLLLNSVYISLREHLMYQTIGSQWKCHSWDQWRKQEDCEVHQKNECQEIQECDSWCTGKAISTKEL